MNGSNLEEDAGSGKNDTAGGRESAVTILTEQERMILFGIFTVLMTIAVVGNVAAINATIRRKHRFLQKTCIISLAAGDLLIALAYGVNNLEKFSHAFINWTLGSFMCHFVPMVQVFGITASTVAIVAIALDRYRNVVYALDNQWNPKPMTCIAGATILWTICIAISYPLARMYELKSSHIELMLPGQPKQQMFFCITMKKNQLLIYQICMCALVFSTLLILFVWLYYNVAKIVWRHRKPVSQYSSSTLEMSSSSTSELTTVTMKRKNVNVERKIRTFKIIITLVIVFILCRAPYWIVSICKLMDFFLERDNWVMLYSFNGLALLNCALNPFLYTFLQFTLQSISRVQNAITDFVSRICCCCISNTEFEEFETGNAFVIWKRIKKYSETRSSNLNRKDTY